MVLLAPLWRQATFQPAWTVRLVKLGASWPCCAWNFSLWGCWASCQFSNPKSTLYRTSNTAGLRNKLNVVIQTWKKMTSLYWGQTRRRKEKFREHLMTQQSPKGKASCVYSILCTSWSLFSLLFYLLLCDFLQNKRNSSCSSLKSIVKFCFPWEMKFTLYILQSSQSSLHIEWMALPFHFSWA